MMTTLTISVSDDLKAFIEAQASERGYLSAGDFVVALLEEEEKRKARAR
jgi:Arc/MetJ-type ribon-helix-helix transcriptional regulator